MRVLVTGEPASSVRNWPDLLLWNDVDVTVLDNLSTGHRENIEGFDVRPVEASTLDERDAVESLRDVHEVVHPAALGRVPWSIEDPFTTRAANATGPLVVLNAARRADEGYLFVSSSSSVCGMNPALLKGERKWGRPMASYAASKFATRQHMLA